MQIVSISRLFQEFYILAKYKKYIDDDKDTVDFEVLIIHGHTQELDKVATFIENKLKFKVNILQHQYRGGTIYEKFRNQAEQSDCAVAIMSPDDKTENGNLRARQNVIYEMGYCQGLFDFYYGEDYFGCNPLIVIKEERIDLKEVSNLLGWETLNYDDGEIEVIFPMLRDALNRIYNELLLR